MYRIRNGQKFVEGSQNVHAVLVPGTLLPVLLLILSQLRSNGHQRIHTGYLQDAERMRTGQTARQPDKPHTEGISNVHPPDILSVGVRSKF